MRTLLYSLISKVIPFLTVVCILYVPAEAKYGGGTGEPNDPYLIYTAEQMNTIGTEPNDWDKHFKLMADIDLSDFDGEDGRVAFNIIAPDIDLTISGHQGSYFTGVFDGNFHTISNFSYTFSGSVYNSTTGIFGVVRDPNALIKNLGLINPSVYTDGAHVGSIAASLFEGTISNCYVECGSVSGTTGVGGLVGHDYQGDVTACFWDTETSGQTVSAGGEGKTTAEMQTERTFTDAGWDFVDETKNGTEDIWWIDEGKDYPRL